MKIFSTMIKRSGINMKRFSTNMKRFATNMKQFATNLKRSAANMKRFARIMKQFKRLLNLHLLAPEYSGVICCQQRIYLQSTRWGNEAGKQNFSRQGIQQQQRCFLMLDFHLVSYEFHVILLRRVWKSNSVQVQQLFPYKNAKQRSNFEIGLWLDF